MAKPYRLAEAQIAARVEAIGGGTEVLASADLFIAQNIKFTPQYGNTENSGLTGVLSKEAGASGQQIGSLSFDVVMKGSGTAGTAPEWRDALMSCGFSETIVGGTSVTYKPAAPESYYTYGLMIPGLGGGGEDLYLTLSGCQGNVKFAWKCGDLRIMSVEAQGTLFTAPADSTIFTVPTWDTTAPTSYMNDATTLHGLTLGFETLEIDMGQTIAMRPNANGITGALTAQITGRRPTLKVDMEADKLASHNIYTKITANTTGALAMTPSASAGNKVALSVPKFRYTGVDHGDRAGALVWQVTGECLRSANAGNDEVSIILT